MSPAKRFFQKVRRENIEKETLEFNLRLQEIEGNNLLHGLNYDRANVQSSKTDDAMSEMIVKIEELKEKYKERIQAIVEDRNLAERLIQSLDNSTERIVMEQYYMSDRKVTLSSIADKINYSVGRVNHIHSEALKKIAPLYKDSNF